MAREPVTGLLLNETRVAWATVSGTYDRCQVLATGGCELEGQAEGSEDRAAPESLQSQVKAACAGVRGEVVVGLAARHVLLRVVDLPSTERDELAGMVGLQVEKFCPFPVDTMVVSHEVLHRGEQASTVLIAAVKQEVAERAGEALAGTGLRPAFLDAEMLGWWTLLSASERIPSSGRHAALILDTGDPALVLADDGVPVSFRSLVGLGELPADELSAEAARELSYTLMAAEKERGAAESCTASVWHGDEAPAELAEAVSRQCGVEPVCCSLAELPSVAEGLARRNLARDGRMLDLVPASWRAAEGERNFRKKLLAATASMAAGWLVLAGLFAGALALQRGQRARLEAERDRWREPALEVRELRRRVFTIRQYMDRSQSALECLREVASLQPPGVELLSFSYRKNEALNVSGEADTSRQALAFNDLLNTSQLFQEVRAGPQAMRRGKHRFSFEIELPEEGE